MAEIKDRLRRLREEKGLVQEQVADALGVTKTAISSYERGARRPRFDMLDNLADFYDVDLNYLTGSSNERKPYPRMTPEEQDEICADHVTVSITLKEMELVKAYRRLDAYGRKMMEMAARLDEDAGTAK